MAADEEIKFMRRCLDLAGRAEGLTYPNPLVGSVIVHQGRIIGEGYHLKAGGPHAEVCAVRSAGGSDIPLSSVLYVNLEPCSHFGRTPPCTDLIIRSGIKKVIIGTTDTSEKVSGNGIRTLAEAGVEVITGVLEKESRWINRRFFTFHEKKRPYIILKWAESADGFIDFRRDDTSRKRPYWISGEAERVLVHKWRADEQSILIGAKTLSADDPRLNIRAWAGEDPLRLVLSSSGLVDTGSALFNIPGRNIVFTHNDKLQIRGTEIIILNREQDSSRQIAAFLFSEGIQSLIVEGGAQVLNHFISTGLWDEARIFYGKESFHEGVKAPYIKGLTISEKIYSNSILKIIENKA
ncbi:MAG TPA: bifunctional diaminohydroxyphosphoribosylaminopyrimidine deaminase/5-amino-6-(5-phosphoribosylamino)uracil reductase RibD [Bacteroidales bacterium]|nr:bifunctional diaminohydroxyphosphoribosylaminopyrimidine deaminase/5-amino-6-(5-phosphoribosylamino)uracil reductase RibD [Bacteroidales bacterium]HPI68371.1 bifunctional diaminohydroxyphosphoribosylaminopyrimidine deaminase/5-amino-6-(5-phosphoribosylamino)uracil reductase RibD [Bacteroidales bacterium]